MASCTSSSGTIVGRRTTGWVPSDWRGKLATRLNVKASMQSGAKDSVKLAADCVKMTLKSALE